MLRGMVAPTPRRRISVRIRLLSPEEGGPRRAWASGSWAHWNLGHTEDGRLAVEGGRLWLGPLAALPPGEEVDALLEPLVPELWARVVPGMVLPMHELSRVIGRAVVCAEDAVG